MASNCKTIQLIAGSWGPTAGLFPATGRTRQENCGCLLPLCRHSGLKTKPQPFRHSGEYVVSAIASLYKGGRYIEQFLENITTQTIFDRSELIIIDADSPEGEEQTIEKYQKNFQISFTSGSITNWASTMPGMSELKCRAGGI